MNDSRQLARFSLRVLVAEDNADAAETLLLLLRHWGHEGFVVPTGLAALEAMRTFRPEVVLLDLLLPELDGHQLAEQLRGQEGGDDVILVAVTGMSDDHHRRRSEELGFAAHLVKPVDPVKLQELLLRSAAMKHRTFAHSV